MRGQVKPAHLVIAVIVVIVLLAVLWKVFLAGPKARMPGVSPEDYRQRMMQGMPRGNAMGGNMMMPMAPPAAWPPTAP